MGSLRRISLLLAMLAVFCSGGACATDQMVVVVSEKSPITVLSRADIIALYLGNLTAQGAANKLRPLDLEDGEARDAFYLALLGRSRTQMRAHWSGRVFSGRGYPPALVKSGDVQAALAADPNAVAYLPYSQVTQRERLLFVLPLVP